MKKLKKRIFALLIISIMLFASINAFAADDISVVLNGERIIFNNAQPIIYEDRTLIPVRAVFEKAGWTVNWNDDTKTAIIGNEKTVVFIAINSDNMQIYDAETDTQKNFKLDVTARIIEDSTMVPLRAICEAMGAEVNWNNYTRTVYIEEREG